MVNIGAIEGLGLAVLFAVIFICGNLLRSSIAFSRHERTLVSFSAGVSLAYVFVDLIPEIETARATLGASVADWPVTPAPLLVSLAALIGCVLFHGIGRMIGPPPSARDLTGRRNWSRPPGMVLHIAIFALYVGVVSYSRINEVEPGPASILFFGLAMGTHFLTVDHALHREHGASYLRIGRFVLAGGALAGWVLGATEAVTPPLMILLFGFISGAVITNSLGEELPRNREGRFAPFLAGSIGYAAILLPLAH